MQKIMIIRHAEKHPHGQGHGIDEAGHPARHELTVRGWQRAGALVHFFSRPSQPASAICAPRAIFASDATKQSPSLRAMHTAGPLAEALGLKVNHHFAEGEEAALAAAARVAASPVLIVWHHGHIVPLVREIAGGAVACPGAWPDARFDVVWILTQRGQERWSFTQIAQQLLAGDSPDLI